MGRKANQKYMLNEKEYNAVTHLADKLKVDSWFSVENSKDGEYDVVHDLERGYNVSLQFGLKLLNEAFEADEELNSTMISEEELIVYKELLKKLNIIK